MCPSSLSSSPSIHAHAGMHILKNCNAASGEYVNNLDENDASRPFPQLTDSTQTSAAYITAPSICVCEWGIEREGLCRMKKACVCCRDIQREEGDAVHTSHVRLLASTRVHSLCCYPLLLAECDKAATKQMTKKKKIGWHQCPLLPWAKSACPVSTPPPPSLIISHSFNAATMCYPLAYLASCNTHTASLSLSFFLLLYVKGK